MLSLPNTFLPSTTITREGVDPQARLTELLRERNPEEAGATRLADTFDNFLSIISGPIGS